MQDRIMRFPEVRRVTGKSKSAIYRDITNGTFPQSVNIGSRAIGWRESVIQRWIDDRIKEGAA